MIEKLKCIMLVDDDPDDNFIHERLIKRNNLAEYVVIKESGKEALAYLRSRQSGNYELPDVIFLDINMPGMDGWEFLDEYNRLDKLSRSPRIAMLTTSQNRDDKTRAEMNGTVYRFVVKPLRKEILEEIINEGIV